MRRTLLRWIAFPVLYAGIAYATFIFAFSSLTQFLLVGGFAFVASSAAFVWLELPQRSGFRDHMRICSLLYVGTALLTYALLTTNANPSSLEQAAYVAWILLLLGILYTILLNAGTILTLRLAARLRG